MNSLSFLYTFRLLRIHSIRFLLYTRLNLFTIMRGFSTHTQTHTHTAHTPYNIPTYKVDSSDHIHKIRSKFTNTHAPSLISLKIFRIRHQHTCSPGRIVAILLFRSKIAKKRASSIPSHPVYNNVYDSFRSYLDYNKAL